MAQTSYNRNRSVQYLPGMLLLLLCGYFVLTFLFMVLANYWPGPYNDYWPDMVNVEKYFNNQLTIHDLIGAHNNAHRLFVPRLLFFADYQWFAGTNTLLVTVSILCKLATLWLFNRVIAGQIWQQRLLLNTLVIAALFNVTNVDNILYNSNIQWDLVTVFSCFSIYFFVQAQSLTARRPSLCLSLCGVFFTLAYLSHGGALALLFVFVFAALLKRQTLSVILSVLFMLSVFYIAFSLLPALESEGSLHRRGLSMLIFKPLAVFAFWIKSLSGMLYHYLPSVGAWFNLYLLVLVVISLFVSIKAGPVKGNYFLYLALFLLGMLFLFALARVNFSPNHWWATRIQTTVILFILAINLHGYFLVNELLVGFKRDALKVFILINSFAVFLLIQYFVFKAPLRFSNKIFHSHAYIFTHERTQLAATDLITFMNPQDRVAKHDPFLRSNGYAYYVNKKSGKPPHADIYAVGETMVKHHLENLANNCPHNPGEVNYFEIDEGGEFAVPLDTSQYSFISIALQRNSWYVLDAEGVVLGFAYLYLDPEHFGKAVIKGFSEKQTANYIVDIGPMGELRCHYRLDVVK